MDLLTKCESLLTEIRSLRESLMGVHQALASDTLEYKERVQLYEKEFEIVMSVAGAQEDLVKYCELLEEQQPEQRFFVNRMIRDLHKLMEEEMV